MCSRVWAIGPSGEEITRIPPSIWHAPWTLSANHCKGLTRRPHTRPSCDHVLDIICVSGAVHVAVVPCTHDSSITYRLQTCSMRFNAVLEETVKRIEDGQYCGTNRNVNYGKQLCWQKQHTKKHQSKRSSLFGVSYSMWEALIVIPRERSSGALSISWPKYSIMQEAKYTRLYNCDLWCEMTVIHNDTYNVYICLDRAA